MCIYIYIYNIHDVIMMMTIVIITIIMLMFMFTDRRQESGTECSECRQGGWAPWLVMHTFGFLKANCNAHGVPNHTTHHVISNM